MKWGMVLRNVVGLVKAPRPTPAEMRALSVEETQRLLEAARGDKLEALYVLAVTTGMRQGELLAAEKNVKNAGDGAIIHRDEHRVRILGEGTDRAGRFLRIEHVWTRPGPMAGPHWHPILTESFVLEEGRMRFRVGGKEFFLGPSEGVTVRPRQVHRFWNEGEGRLAVTHEIRPPGRHREMFELWHRLNLEGKTNRQGVPTSPLALGLLWELQDGYVAGVPTLVQRLVFGGLARLARRTGYRA